MVVQHPSSLVNHPQEPHPMSERWPVAAANGDDDGGDDGDGDGDDDDDDDACLGNL